MAGAHAYLVQRGVAKPDQILLTGGACSLSVPHLLASPELSCLMLLPYHAERLSAGSMLRCPPLSTAARAAVLTSPVTWCLVSSRGGFG